LAIKYWRVRPFRIGARSFFMLGRSVTTLMALSLVLILVVACSDGGDDRTDASNSSVTPTNELAVATSPTPVTSTSPPTLAPIPDTPVSVAPTVSVIPTLTPTPTAVATPKPAANAGPTPTTAPSAAAVPTGTLTAIATVTPTLPTPTSAPIQTPVPTNTPGPPSSQELASEGAGIYESNCTGCHSRDSDTKIGPGHRNVYSRAATRVSGLSAGDYIRQSLLDPSAFVVSGFPSIMPKFSFFTDVQILALIEYLKSL